MKFIHLAMQRGIEGVEKTEDQTEFTLHSHMDDITHQELVDIAEHYMEKLRILDFEVCTNHDDKTHSLRCVVQKEKV